MKVLHVAAPQGHQRQGDQERTLVIGLQRDRLHFRGAHADGLVPNLDLAAHLHDRILYELRARRLVHFAEEHALDGAFHVLDGDDRPRVALLRDSSIDVGNQSRQRDLLPAGHGGRTVNQMGDGHLPHPGEHCLHAAQRMVRHVEAKHIALELELVLLVPFLDVRHGDRRIPHRVGARILRVGEQVELSFRLLALEADHRVDRRLVHGEQRPAVRVDRPFGTTVVNKVEYRFV